MCDVKEEIDLIVEYFQGQQFSLEDAIDYLESKGFTVLPPDTTEFLHELNIRGYICTNGKFFRRGE